MTAISQQPSPDEALAAGLEITFDGKRYCHRSYHYDRFSDAVNFAQASASRTGFVPDQEFIPSWREPFCPSAEELQRMKPYGITYAHGYYLYRSYRYDQLAHALAYAAAYQETNWARNHAA